MVLKPARSFGAARLLYAGSALRGALSADVNAGF